MKYLKVWTSFREITAPLEEAEIGRLFIAMLAYAESGEEPGTMTGNERFIWPYAKQMIDLAAERAETLRQNGSKGGQAKSRNRQELANDSKSYQDEANDSKDKQNQAYKEKKSKEKKSKEKESSIGIIPLSRFTPPTLDEVEDYCRQRNNRVNAEKFFTYYTSNGWKVGRNPMKDWRAAIRTWEQNEDKRNDYADLPY